MSLLAAVFHWTADSPDVGYMRGLLSALPERSPDGRYFARAPHAILGIGRRVVRRAERADLQPLIDREKQICAVGDVRLDNRSDIGSLLGMAPCSDLALIVAAYDRWGPEVIERLVGDFAFVIWDWGRRQACVARDAFGVRSLVYRQTPDALIFATEPAQLLALQDTDRTPDDQVILDTLSWSYAHYGPTCFRTIKSVRPGHYMVARAEGVRETEYFRPPAAPTRLGSLDEYHRSYRELFRTAVRDRLDSEGPVVAHLSGGLDSSSIVCAAAQEMADNRRDLRTSLITASAVYPGQPEDETPFIDLVTSFTSLPSRRWRGDVPSGREFVQAPPGIPGATVASNGGAVGDIEVAKQLGSRALLSGEGGDAITMENGLFNHLLMTGRWCQLVEQVMVAGSSEERGTRIRMARRAAREETPRRLLKLWDLKNPGPAAPPEWLQPDLHRLWIDRRSRIPQVPRPWFSRLQRGTWEFLRGPRQAWVVDYFGAYSAAAGIEVRYPFLDARLVRFLLSIPPEYRLLGPLRRWFHRQAMRGILPEEIASRPSKPNFNFAVVRWGHNSVHRIRELFEGSLWRSGRYVDQDKARNLLNRLAARPASAEDWNDWRSVRCIVNVETWHRAVFGYPSDPETMLMSDITNEEAPRQPVVGGTDQCHPYVPPKLTSVGNVRELLAGANLTGSDDVTPQTFG